MTTKQAVIDLIQRMPDDVTVNDIMSELDSRQKTDDGRRQVDPRESAGRHEGVLQRDESPPGDDSWVDIIDHEIIATAEREAEGEVSLGDLRRLLSSIKGSMSDVVIEQRGEY